MIEVSLGQLRRDAKPQGPLAANEKEDPLVEWQTQKDAVTRALGV